VFAHQTPPSELHAGGHSLFRRGRRGSQTQQANTSGSVGRSLDPDPPLRSVRISVSSAKVTPPCRAASYFSMTCSRVRSSGG
jgi:hypothetical protein